MSLPVALFLASVFLLAACAMLADSRAVRPAAILRGVLALAPVATAIVLAGCR